MKKQGVTILLIVAIVFASVLIGFFLGRNIGKSPVYISKSPESTSPTAATEATQPASKININTASAQELESLPGIGPVIAQRIVDYRNENGAFQTVSELTNVKGIGLSLLEKVMDYVTV